MAVQNKTLASKTVIYLQIILLFVIVASEKYRFGLQRQFLQKFHLAEYHKKTHLSPMQSAKRLQLSLYRNDRLRYFRVGTTRNDWRRYTFTQSKGPTNRKQI